MEVTINYNGQAVAVEVTLEVYEFLDRANHKTENLFHEQETVHVKYLNYNSHNIEHESVSQMCTLSPSD